MAEKDAQIADLNTRLVSQSAEGSRTGEVIAD